MPAFHDNVRTLFAAGSTGNATSPAVDLPADVTAIAVQHVIEAAGATPTITLVAQVSLDGVNYVAAPVISETSDAPAADSNVLTAVGTKRVFVALGPGQARKYKSIRIVASANTNITFRSEVYLVRGGTT